MADHDDAVGPTWPVEGPDAARARAAFMRDLAHEVSTPLTPLAGYLKILRSEKVGALSEQQRRMIDTMQVSVARLTRLVQNLGDFASLGVDRAPLALGPVDPDALAEQVVEELRPYIKDARLEVSVAKGGGGPVLADPRKLRQAVTNLVSNAVKFSPHGAAVLVAVSRADGRVRFSVYDQGPGVPAPQAAAVFEPFAHAKARVLDPHPHFPGSGLGLPVARRIAEAHGGRIWLESPPGVQPVAGRHYSGARFTLEVPAAPAPAEAPAGQGPAGPLP